LKFTSNGGSLKGVIYARMSSKKDHSKLNAGAPGSLDFH
jgi:hypothetical protein